MNISKVNIKNFFRANRTKEHNTAANEKDRLWTSSFFILWQGQLVSTLGDAAYSIALGFWVLAATGSTALMGTLMAASTLPGVIISPFAGVMIDRYNKKLLLILMDIIRGISILLLSIASFKGYIAIWMGFAAGIILSVCGAVFRPGINSSIPDLVHPSKITNANSLFAVVTNGANMVGNALGGFLLQLSGSAFMFLFNGMSYLFSGLSIFFVKAPKKEKKSEQHFWRDMKDGFSFMWKLKGLRYIIIVIAFINFFFNMSLVLFLPLFQKTSYLGPGKYGIAIACFMGGAMAGYLLTSILKIKPDRKFGIFVISGITSNLCFILFTLQHIFIIMIVLLLAGGFFNSILNVILMSSVQIATPKEVRGKVLAFMSMVSQGLSPFAMALGGILGGIIPIRTVMLISFLIILLIVIPFNFVNSFKRFLNFDYEKDSIENIMEN